MATSNAPTPKPGAPVSGAASGAGKPSSIPAPPKSGGNLKYALLGLLFLGGAVALWATLGEAPAPAAAPAPTPEVARVNPMAEPELVVEPEPEPAPEAPPEPTARDTAPKKKRDVNAPVSTSGWDCAGEIDVAQVRAVIDANRAQVRSCYERRLKVNNVLQGTLKLQVKVGATGQVAQTSVGGTLNDKEVSACVRHLAETWRFPAPDGGACAVVAAPFQFSPLN